jgi:hypothetical protein
VGGKSRAGHGTRRQPWRLAAVMGLHTKKDMLGGHLSDPPEDIDAALDAVASKPLSAEEVDRIVRKVGVKRPAREKEANGPWFLLAFLIALSALLFLPLNPRGTLRRFRSLGNPRGWFKRERSMPHGLAVW